MQKISADPIVVARLVNGVATIACGIYIGNVYLGTRPRRIFYLAWSIGFLFYGVQILSRLILPVFSIEVGLLFFATFFFITAGLGVILRKSKPFLVTYSVLTVLTFVFYALNMPPPIVQGLGYSPWLLVTIGILAVRKLYGPAMDNMLFGWFLVIINNFLDLGADS